MNFGLSEFLPPKIYVAVPKKFRKSAQIPPDIEIFKTDFQAEDFDERFGFPVMRPLKSVVDLLVTRRSEEHLIRAAFIQMLERGLTTDKEIEALKTKSLPVYETLSHWRQP